MALTGNADVAQMSVTGNTTQTANVVEVRNAANTVQYNIRGDYAVTDSTSFASKAYVDGVVTAMSGGEVNTATNVGTSGVAVVNGKVGLDLQFRAINPASSRMTASYNAGTKTVDLDVNEANLSLANVGGVLPVVKGGTGASTGAASLANLGGLPAAGGMMTGTLTMDNQNMLEFRESTGNGAQAVQLRAPASLASNLQLTLPSSVIMGGVMVTDGVGNLSFANPASLTVGFATQFSMNPTDCAAGAFANSIDAFGNLSCTPVSMGTVSGILPVTNGGTNSGASLIGNRVMISSGSSIVESQTLNLSGGGLNVVGNQNTIQLMAMGYPAQSTNIFEIRRSDSSLIFGVDNSGKVVVNGKVVNQVATFPTSPVNFSTSSAARYTGTGPCTIDIQGTTPGGHFTLTMPSVSNTCSLTWNGTASAVKLPAGYSSGTAVSGMMYELYDDGVNLWVSSFAH
jgi:hypothetical protein